MKKRFLISLLLAGLFVLPASALEFQHGPIVNLGVVGSVKPYVYESIGYKLDWNYVGLDADLRILENVMYNKEEPFFYLEPTLNLYLGALPFSTYLGIGAIISPKWIELVEPYFRFGALAGGWNWGEGIGSIDVGCEISPTIVYSEGPDELGTAIGTVFLSLLNFCKFNVGVSYFVPIK